jgi:hypothetical protein
MRHNVLADHPDIDPARFDAVTITAHGRAFPDAWVDIDDDLVARMDNAPEDRHVLATAVTADADLIVTSNIDDFTTSRHVTSGTIGIQPPGAFLTVVLTDHPDILTTALLHLATNRRGVTTIADVLDQLARHDILGDFVQTARERLL